MRKSNLLNGVLQSWDRVNSRVFLIALFNTRNYWDALRVGCSGCGVGVENGL